jgi:prepilin-type N-terminal cleavage/methylation domain-containing protein
MDFKMKQKGFTLVEILIVIAVLIIISAVILNVFRSYDEKEALSQDTSKVVSVLERARQLTLFSRDSFQYGVHFDTDKIVLYKGAGYIPASLDNIETLLHSKVIISAVVLNGGGSEILFKRLSGETDQNGTITLQNKLDNSKTKIVTIDKTGLVK